MMQPVLTSSTLFLEPDNSRYTVQTIIPAAPRKYQTNDGQLTFQYNEKPLTLLRFENSRAISGSVGHGYAGVICGSRFYYQDFTKQAEAFRKKSPFWDVFSARSIEYEHPPKCNDITDDQCFVWFNIGGYWHWFCEDLPCIQGFREVPEIPIYTNKLADWQKQSLTYFPDIADRVIEVDTPATVVARQIYAVTYPATSYRGMASKWVGMWLNKNMQVKYQWDRRKTYIGRKDAVARRVENEDQVIEMLRKYDFKIHTRIDHLNVQQKIDLFAASDCVVSPTGAGLTHCYAMRPNTTVIDFNHAFEVNQECGWNNLGDSVGLRWYTLPADTGKQPTERPKIKNSGLIVDVDLLEHYVKEKAL